MHCVQRWFLFSLLLKNTFLWQLPFLRKKHQAVWNFKITELGWKGNKMSLTCCVRFLFIFSCKRDFCGSYFFMERKSIGHYEILGLWKWGRKGKVSLMTCAAYFLLKKMYFCMHYFCMERKWLRAMWNFGIKQGGKIFIHKLVLWGSCLFSPEKYIVADTSFFYGGGKTSNIINVRWFSLLKNKTSLS